MPTNDFISSLLEIKDLIVTKIENNYQDIHIFFKLERRDHICPCCGALTNKVHDYRTSIIKDSPIMGKHTFLHYNKRRYHCDACNHHFVENFSFLPKNCRITNRLGFLSIHLLRDTQNVSTVAKQMGVSPSTVFRRLRDVSYPKPTVLPQVLSIDEFRGNAGGQKFQAILTNPKKHTIVDILPSRTQSLLASYIREFKNRNDVKYFIMDMNVVYRDIALTYLPNATIVIDKFHVVRYVTWALENVRRRIQKTMHPSRRKYFKRSKKLLLSHKDKLSEENKDALEVMLSISPDLATAYYLKELFYNVMNSKSKAEAIPKLKTFILSAYASELDEFKPCLTMLFNWEKFILNAFECPYTNGFTEGTNNKIKVIKRNAYGYRNFNNFRNRIMLTTT